MNYNCLIRARGLLVFAATCLAAVVIITGSPVARSKVFQKQEVPFGWQEKRSVHFIIYSDPNISKNYVRRVINRSEKLYEKITEQLGFDRFDFWLWEDRAKIFIYDTIEQYQKERKEPEWSGASVNVREKKIYTFHLEEKFFSRFLPHEIGHIIFNEFVGMDTPIPLWLNEGVASAMEGAGRFNYVVTAKGFVESGMYLKMPELRQMEKRNLNMPTMFYAQSASLVIFLQEKFKRRKFSDFGKELRDGKSVEEALEKVYRIKGTEELAELWQKYIKAITYRDILKKYGSVGSD